MQCAKKARQLRQTEAGRIFGLCGHCSVLLHPKIGLEMDICIRRCHFLCLGCFYLCVTVVELKTDDLMIGLKENCTICVVGCGPLYIFEEGGGI